MKSLTCQKCSSPLRWDGASEIVTCQYCGTQYVMHPRSRQTSRIETVGSGENSFIATSTGRYSGWELCKSYIPKDWTARTSDPTSEANLLAPMTMQVEYASPDGGSFITYTGEKAYDHLEYNMQTAAIQGRVRVPEYTIGLCYMPTENLCEYMVNNNPSILHPQLESESKVPDEWAARLAESIIADYARNNLIDPGYEWIRRIYSCTDKNGNNWKKQIEILQTRCCLPYTPEEMQAYQMLMQSQIRLAQTQSRIYGMVGGIGGMLGSLLGGAGAANSMIQGPPPKLRWGTVYVIEISSCTNLGKAAEEARKIRETFGMLPIFASETEKLRQQIMIKAQQDSAVINNAMSNMANEQMRSWDRKQDIIRSTQNATMDTMHQMMEGNAHTNERIANLQSEAIRGVNTFYTNQSGFGVPDIVEADVRWDHVYQNMKYPDVFAASEGTPLEFGVDFEELNNTNGNY